MCIRMSWVRRRRGGMGCSIEARRLGQLAGAAVGGCDLCAVCVCGSVCAALRGVYSKQHNPPTSLLLLLLHMWCVCVCALRHLIDKPARGAAAVIRSGVWLVCR